MSVDHSFINTCLLYTHSSTDTLKLVLTNMLKDKELSLLPKEAVLIIEELKKRCEQSRIILKVDTDTYMYHVLEVRFSNSINKVN